MSVVVNEVQAAGAHQDVFNGGGLNSGLYFFRLQKESWI
jgi:hypothetical protein